MAFALREVSIMAALISVASASFVQWILFSVCFQKVDDPFPSDGAIYSPPVQEALPSAESLSAQCENKTFDYGPGYEIRPDVLLPDYNYNLTKIRIGIVDRAPYHFRDPNATVKNGSEWTGIAIDMLEIMRERLNFTYELVTPTDNDIGYIANDKWTGLMGMLVRREVDVGAALMHISPERSKAVEFSLPLGEAGYSILVERPGKTNKQDALLAPFTTYVWILILVASLLMGPLIYAVVYIRVSLCKNEDLSGVRRYDQLLSVSEYVWYVYGAILRQGSVVEPYADSTRMLLATWWIFVTVLSAFYTANLTAFLTLAKYDTPIGTIHDVAKNRDVDWAARGGGEIEQLIKYTPPGNESDDFAALRSSIRPDSFAYPLKPDFNTKILDSVATGRVVYIDSRDVLRYMVINDYKSRRLGMKLGESASCRFLVADDDASKYHFAFAFPKEPEIKHIENFGPYIRRMLESGLIHQWRNKLFPDAEICVLSKGFQERSLNNSDLMSTYYVTLYGMLAALIGFIIERVYRYYKNKKIADQKQKDAAGGNFSQQYDWRLSKAFETISSATHPKAQEGIARQVFAGLPPTSVSRMIGTGQKASLADKTDFPHLQWSSDQQPSNKQPSAFSWDSRKSDEGVGPVTTGYDDKGNQINFVNNRPYVFVKVDGDMRAVRAEKAVARRY